MNPYVKKYSQCLNCGKQGHEQRSCTEPITSWGIILVKISKQEIVEQVQNSQHNDTQESQQQQQTQQTPHGKMNLRQYENMPGFPSQTLNELMISASCMEKIKFLLVRRKHSLGFDEFINGRYNVEMTTGIRYLFTQMTPEEIKLIKNSTFDELWKYFWGNHNFTETPNKRYLESKEKFDKLKTKASVEFDLDFFVDTATPTYETPEWGFPKGRKKRGEGDMTCAVREFCEETGLSASDIKILHHITPIIEDHTGTNGKKYKHIYYIAEQINNNEPSITINSYEHSEIGAIGFFSFEEAVSLLREYHREKKEILKKIMNLYISQMKFIGS